MEGTIPNGTRIFVLPMGAILAAAQQDIYRFQRNKTAVTCERYAFHRVHVRKAMRGEHPPTGEDVIRIAMADIGRGLESSKRELYLQLKEHHAGD